MFTLNCKGKLLAAGKPLVMGIINATPDSFYEGSRFTRGDEILRQAEKMLTDGADILDIGGQSTRPGSEETGVETELERVIDAVESISVHFPQAIISIDTYYAKVAREAVGAGAAMVNDISAGNQDADMFPVVAGLNVPYVCMHMKGKPKTMQQNPVYDDITREVLDFFISKINDCKQAGIYDVIIDPGFGFGKTIRHNFELLKNLSVFSMLGRPLLLGISRKSTIYRTLGITAGEALNGTTVLHTIGLEQGAGILRVHDVKEAKEAIHLFSEYQA
jgi:dihydropteroate synthase